MKRGLSPYIALVITVSLLMTVTILVLTTINPTLDKITDSNVINEGVQNLELINSAIKQVASESQGSKRTLSITVSDGYYRVNTGKEWIYFDYDTKSDFFIEGTMGNVRLDRSPVFVEYFNQYQDNSNASGTWVPLNGTVRVETGEYSIENGTSYYNYGNLNNFKLAGKISNKVGKGEIFIVPGAPENLVLFLPLDEGSGNNMTYDYSLHRNNGTQHGTNLTGNATSGWTTDCKYGSCLKFDGVNDRVTVSDSSSLNISGNMSISLWVKLASSTSSQAFLGKRLDTLPLGIRATYEVRLYTNNRFEFLWQNTTGTFFEFVDSDTTSKTDKWVHIVVTRNTSNGEVKIYRDGTLSTSFTNTDSNNVGYRPSDLIAGLNSEPIYVGFTGSDVYTNGTIDEVKIYNRVLTASEVKSEYEASTKKLTESGETDAIQQETNVSIVLANPSGHTHFDNIKLKTGKKKMQLIVPFAKVDINGTLTITKGTYSVSMEHKGLNSTTNRPIIHISR